MLLLRDWSPNVQNHDVGEFVEVSVNWTETFGFGMFGGTYASTGFAEKELIGADGLADVVLTVVEFEPIRHSLHYRRWVFL